MEIETLHQHFLKSTGICTDTRNIKSGCLFFALKGENFNANVFAKEALTKGAYKAIIDEDKYHDPDGDTILTTNVLSTLQQLASFHRKYLRVPIIALTGSNGKTTTKELINAVLSEKYKTVATKGNLNNHIGVPLTLLSMNTDTEIGIVEMGANHLKEIENLCNIAKPDYGYITNFGKAHLEGFGGVEGVIKGKTELYKYLEKENKIVFINESDAVQVENSINIESYTFGDENQDCYIQLKDASYKVSVEFKKTLIKSNLIGLYNYENIAAAIAIGDFFEVSEDKVKKAIESYIPINNRSQTIQKGTNQIILDAYNANPSSMIAALKNFKQAQGKNKVLFLGDMFELGKETVTEHQTIVDYLKENSVGKVYLIGSNFYETQTNDEEINKFKTFDDLKNHLQTNSVINGFILIKASRGMALERILELI